MVKSTFDTIYYNGKAYPHRFDTKQLFDIMFNYTSLDEDEDVMSFYANINQHKYVLTITIKKQITVTISLLALAGTTDKTIHNINTSKFPYEYPVFQHTTNPVIVLMLCHLCKWIFTKDMGLSEGFENLTEDLAKQLVKHKDYELDIITILAMINFTDAKWYNINDVINRCINKKNNELAILFDKIYKFTPHLTVCELSLPNNNISYFVVRTKPQIYTIPLASKHTNIHAPDKIVGAPIEIFNKIIYLLREKGHQ